MTHRTIAFALAILIIGLTVPGALFSQHAATSGSKNAAPSQVHSIVLPQYPPEIPPGPNIETYRKDCLTCHTARYVLMQPSFSKTVWQNEVKKMVDAYGAPIPETDRALIVDYLVSVKGVPTPPSAATPSK